MLAMSDPALATSLAEFALALEASVEAKNAALKSSL